MIHGVKAILIVVLLAALPGCPQPIPKGSSPPVGSNTYTRTVPPDAAKQIDGDAAKNDQAAEEAKNEAGAQPAGPPLDEDAARSGQREPYSVADEVAPADEKAGEVEHGGAQEDVAQGGSDDDAQAQRDTPGTPDADEFIDFYTEDGEKSPERLPSRVSEASLAFAGSWRIVVVHKDGRGAMLQGEDAWVIELARDGRCTISKKLGGDTWRQTGDWEYDNGALSLALGPGGTLSYQVDEAAADVSLLTSESGGSVLFCIRMDAGAEASSVAGEYESDFGPLSFRRSGPGRWKGSYGEPQGTLLLHQLGRFLVGTWEQSPYRGFAIFELQGSEFEGHWWYEGSAAFDGSWHGRAAG
ncbi:hypothetical protein IIA79_02390 [bacterium]|nr:hypothetical protein [bacterium]